jgi:hypothetical protein
MAFCQDLAHIETPVSGRNRATTETAKSITPTVGASSQRDQNNDSLVVILNIPSDCDLNGTHICGRLPHAKRACMKVYPGKYLGPPTGRFVLINLVERLAEHNRFEPIETLRPLGAEWGFGKHRAPCL